MKQRRPVGNFGQSGQGIALAFFIMSTNQAIIFQILKKIYFFPLILLFHFVGRIIFSPLMVTIRQELSLTLSDSGGLFFYSALGAGLGLLLNIFLSPVLCHRKTIVLSTFLMGLSLCGAAAAHSYPFMALSILATGLSAGIYFPSGLATITSIIKPANWGRALGVNELAPNLAFIVAPIIAEFFLFLGSWRISLVTIGLFQMGLGACFALFTTGGGFCSAPLSLLNVRQTLTRPLLWVFVLYFSFAIGAVMGPYLMLPLFLTEVHHLPREVANQLLAYSRITGLFMTFVVGYFTDRVGVRKVLGTYFLLTSIATIGIGGATGFTLYAIIFIQSLLSGCFFPAGFTAVSKAFPIENRSLAVSLITPCAVLFGQGVMPKIIGLMGDYGYFSLSFILIGVSMSCCLLFLPQLRKVDQLEVDK